MSRPDTVEMSDKEKEEYITETLAMLHQFLSEASPTKHAVLLMLDEDDQVLQTYNFNAPPTLAVMMMGSSMELLREEMQGVALQRTLN
jgi:hypothetical protein